MDLEGIMLSEISQTEKDKYHMISLICGIYNKNQNKQTNRSETDLYRQHFDDCQIEQGWGLGEKGEGIKTYKLVATE